MRKTGKRELLLAALILLAAALLWLLQAKPSNAPAAVQEASCPDHLCIRQGKISREGEMIVCLPNRMIAEVKGHPAS